MHALLLVVLLSFAGAAHADLCDEIVDRAAASYVKGMYAAQIPQAQVYAISRATQDLKRDCRQQLTASSTAVEVPVPAPTVIASTSPKMAASLQQAEAYRLHTDPRSAVSSAYRNMLKKYLGTLGLSAADIEQIVNPGLSAADCQQLLRTLGK